MAEGKEFFSGEIAVGELVAEKDPSDRRDGEHATREILLPLFKLEHRHVIEDLHLPGAPDGNFKHHHEEQFETWASVHKVGCGGGYGKEAHVASTERVSGCRRCSVLYKRTRWSVCFFTRAPLACTLPWAV